jgi:hypothetical protein
VVFYNNSIPKKDKNNHIKLKLSQQNELFYVKKNGI